MQHANLKKKAAKRRLFSKQKVKCHNSCTKWFAEPWIGDWKRALGGKPRQREPMSIKESHLVHTIEIFHFGCGKISMGCWAKMRGNATFQNFASILDNKSFHVEVMMLQHSKNIAKPNFIRNIPESLIYWIARNFAQQLMGIFPQP